MIKINKIPTLYVPKNILRNAMIESVKKLNVLKEDLFLLDKPSHKFINYIMMANMVLPFFCFWFHGSTI